MKNREFSIPSVSDLPEAVKWLLEQANGQKKIMLYGEMGAGKTTFAKAFCSHLGILGNDKFRSYIPNCVNSIVYQLIYSRSKRNVFFY